MSISRDTFDPTKQYRRIRYHQRRDLLDSELNEQQDIASHDQQQLFDVLFSPGAIAQGLAPTVNGAEVTLADGRVYADGQLILVPGAILQYDPAKTTGTDDVWVEVLRLVVDATVDASLVSPSTGDPTAEREQWVTSLQSRDTSADSLPPNGLGRTVVAIYAFDRDNGALTPTAPTMLTVQDKPRLDGHIGVGGTQHPVATPAQAGFMSAEDKSALENISVGLTPTGAVIAFAGFMPPTGWLECDGMAISRTMYAALFSVIGTTYGAGDGQATFNLPDLRGEFVRGWDHLRGVDPGRTRGSGQDAAYGAHTHTIYGDTSGGDNPWGGIERKISTDNGGVDDATTSGVMAHLWAGTSGGAETRPRNIAMMYLIKT